MGAGCCSQTVDVESGRHVTFDDDFIRRNFIKKVYFILSIQLLVTLGIVMWLSTSDEFYDFVEENPRVFLLALVVLFVTLLVLVCCSDLRRIPPYNYFFLGIFTLAEAFLLSVIASKIDPHIVFMALALTTLISVTLSIYAMQTKVDFTAMGGILLVFLILLLIVGLVALFFHTSIMMTIYCSMGVMLYSIFLIYDTQLMVGGDHAFAISPDEVVFAALNLYIDIIQLFLFILNLLSSDN